MINKILTGKNIISFDVGEHNHAFIQFDEGYSLSTDSLFRYIGKDGTFLSREDHNQQFGLPNPFNAESEIQKQIMNQTITKVIVESDTGDLKIFVPNGRIEIICSSAGYEAYEIHGPENLILVGRGGTD